MLKNFDDKALCLPILKKFRIMLLPCLYICHCLMNVKENLPSPRFRQDFHQFSNRKNFLLDTFCAQLQTTKSSHIIQISFGG